MEKEQRNWQGVNSELVDKLKANEHFIHKAECGCGVPIHTFRIPGESIEGRLRPCQKWDRADRAKTAELHYYTATGQDAAVAIRLSTMLWKAINGNHLWGQWIRITYQGSVQGKFPNATKIYLVERDKGTTTENYERVEINGNSKNRKSRAKKPIRRPLTAAAAR